LHRDLKPGNILVADSQVKLLDFGLSVLREQTADVEIAGTLPYIAPEILQGGSASEASDLYAVGAIAYELFAGRHPFVNPGSTSLINDILYTAPDFSLLDIDTGLLNVVEKLLAKRIEERYRDAIHVIRALHEATGHAFPIETITLRESFLQSAPFVGRDDTLSDLLKCLDDLVNGKGSAWLIGGESGVGKSRLLNEMRTHILVKGALILNGQLDQIGTMSLPEKVVAGGVREIVRHRLNRVRREDQPLLRLAAVGGRQMDLQVLKQLEPTVDLDRWLAQATGCTT
jgi:serine/threonine protein kinase